MNFFIRKKKENKQFKTHWSNEMCTCYAPKKWKNHNVVSWFNQLVLLFCGSQMWCYSIQTSRYNRLTTWKIFQNFILLFPSNENMVCFVIKQFLRPNNLTLVSWIIFVWKIRNLKLAIHRNIWSFFEVSRNWLNALNVNLIQIHCHNE